jgi:NADH dehydrogenase FAD-containing subunit
MAMASESHMEKFWVKYEDIPALQEPNIHVLQGSVEAVDLSSKTATLALPGTTESISQHYDYLVTATGLRRVWPVVPQSLRRKQYLFEVGDHLRNVQTARHGVVVVGGGAVGIETAAELKLIQPETAVTLVHSREHLLSAEPLPEETKAKALELLRDSGVNVLMSHRLESTKKVQTDDLSRCVELTFTNGHKMRASEVIMAISRSTPATRFLPAEVLDEEGYVKINSEYVSSSEMFLFTNAVTDRHPA